MEGFLYKKGRGASGSLFSTRNWKLRWFILEGDVLTYYEGFDKATNKPFNKKGVIPVKDCEVTEVEHHEKQNVFVLKHNTRKPIFFYTEDKELMESNKLI